DRQLVRRYEALAGDRAFQTFLGHSGHANYGYWRADTRRGQDACDNLVDLLLAGHDGPVRCVLDVGCGRGGAARRLTGRFGAGRVAAIDLSLPQLRAAQTRAPGARALLMDAAHLALRDECADVVLCIEAAFHFRTRADFVHQAFRVLRPGGRLLL